MARPPEIPIERLMADQTPATRGFVVSQTSMANQIVAKIVGERLAKMEARIAELEEMVTNP